MDCYTFNRQGEIKHLISNLQELGSKLNVSTKNSNSNTTQAIIYLNPISSKGNVHKKIFTRMNVYRTFTPWQPQHVNKPNNHQHRIDKHIMICAYNRILLHNLKEPLINTATKMDESQEYADQKKPTQNMTHYKHH